MHYSSSKGARSSDEFAALTGTSVRGNTTGMKVAVSIPDEVFAETEELAKRLGTSRSEIYSRALREFLGRHAPDRVTELMNQAIAAVGEKNDPFVERAGRHALRRVEW
jgi:predicted transcriptional regulator